MNERKSFGGFVEDQPEYIDDLLADDDVETPLPADDPSDIPADEGDNEAGAVLPEGDA